MNMQMIREKYFHSDATVNSERYVKEEVNTKNCNSLPRFRRKLAKINR